MNQIRVSEEVVCSDTLIFYMPLMCVDFTFMLISSLSLERVQILPQDGFPAHGVHQADLHAG